MSRASSLLCLEDEHSTLLTNIEPTLLDPNDPLSITELTQISNIQGNNWATVYDVPDRRISRSTPEGRSYTVTLDANDRLVREEVTGVLPVEYEYDARGRLISCSTR